MALSVLLGLLVIGALQGGLAMVTNPVDPLGMSSEFLNGSPVDDYFWPGMFLLGIAGASLLTVAGLLVRWRWDWAAGIEEWVGYSWPWIGAISTGIVLLGPRRPGVTCAPIGVGLDRPCASLGQVSRTLAVA